MKLNKLTIALLASSIALPSMAAQLTSFECADYSVANDEGISFSNENATYAIDTDFATDGDNSLMGDYQNAWGGVIIAKDGNWDLSDSTTFSFDIQNNGTSNVVIAARLFDSEGEAADGHKNETYFNVDPGLHTITLVLADGTGTITNNPVGGEVTTFSTAGANFDQSAVAGMRLFVGDTVPADINIDNIVVDGTYTGNVCAAEAPVEPTDPDLSLPLNFDDMTAGTVIDDSNGASSNMLSADYSVSDGGLSWEITYAAAWTAASLWSSYDLSADGATLDIQIRNDEAADLPFVVKFLTVDDDINWADTSPYAASFYPSLTVNDDFQTVSIDLANLSDIGTSFDLANVGAIQFMTSAGAGTVYIDNIELTVPDAPTDPEEPGNGGVSSSGGSFGGLGALLLGALVFFRRKFS